MHEEEYITTIGGAVGARVVIHPFKAMPFPAELGFRAKPGELVSLGIGKVDPNFATTEVVFLYSYLDCPSCLAHLNGIGWATLTI